MRVVMFCHSVRSCWNHGNAHFLRGVATELMARGHHVRIHEPRDGWSVDNLVREHGDAPLRDVAAAFPHLGEPVTTAYDPDTLDLDRVLDRVDVVIVHEWSPHALVARIGAHRARARSYRLLFHDTHHRVVTDPASMAAYDLGHYDGVLAFGRVLRDLYIERGLTGRAWTWHEAADIRVFRPMADLGPRDRRRDEPGRDRAVAAPRGDLVWIGNWGDGERCVELDELLIRPVADLGLSATVYGVRYPPGARARLAAAGIAHGGWLPNHRVPRAFARHRVTVHVPRRPYVRALPGIPTIRPFEALACGIPLVTGPWHDAERLFTPGDDFLVARTGDEMKRCLRAVLADPALARHLAEHGRRTILARHTCGHRVDELLQICRELGAEGAGAGPAAPPIVQ